MSVRPTLKTTNLMARIWPPRYRPMLDFLLDLGVLRIQTCLMRDCDYAMVKEYIALECTVLMKWGIRFRLYNTMQRLVDR